jgi:sugar lactone lactonase YvrE
MFRRFQWMVGLLALRGLAGCGEDPSVSPRVSEPTPGRVTTAVGTGRQGYDGDGKTPLESWLNQPTEVAFDPDGTLYLVDWNNHRLRSVSDGGVLETRVGGRLPGDWPPELALDQPMSGSELPINHPMDVAFSGDEVVLAAWHNHKILSFDAASERVRVIAGGNRPGYTGDGGAAQAALLNFPEAVAVQPDGGLLISDQRNNLVRRIAPDGERAISTAVGVKGLAGLAGDGEPANAARLGLSPYDEAGGADNPPPGGALALADDGSLYFADTYNHCVRKVAPGSDGLVGAGDPSEETIATFVGRCGVPGYEGAGGTGAELRLRTPNDLEVYDGALYVADTGNHVIWRVDLESAHAERLVGTGEAGSVPDGSKPLETALNRPWGLAFDSVGNLYIADTMNNRVRVLWK